MNLVNLKKARKERGIKQEEMAKLLNISQSNYSRCEKGDINMTPENLKKISIYLDLTTDYLLGIIDRPMGLGEWFVNGETEFKLGENPRNAKSSKTKLTEEEKDLILKYIEKINNGEAN